MTDLTSPVPVEESAGKATESRLTEPNAPTAATQTPAEKVVLADSATDATSDNNRSDNGGNRKDGTSGDRVDLSALGIIIPPPTAFSEISRISPHTFSMFEALLPRDSRLLALFVSEEDRGRLLRNEQATFQQYMLVQSDKAIEEYTLTKADFAELRTLFRKQFETTLQNQRTDIDSLVEKAGENVGKGLGIPLSTRMDNMTFLRVDSETASSISASLLIKFTSSIAGKQTQSVMAGVMTNVLVKGKIIRLYVYTGYNNDSDLAWARVQTQDWIKNILAANEPTWPVASGAIVPQGTIVTSAVKELLSSEWLEYHLKLHPKAHDLDISLKYPKPWKAEEGTRPHIVQKFTGQTVGGSSPHCMVLVIQNQPAWAKLFLEEGMADGALVENLKELIPDNARLIDGGRTQLDGELCAWLKFSYEIERVGVRWQLYSLGYFLFHQGSTLIIQCDVGSMAGDEEVLEDIFTSYLPVFQMVGNSVVIHDKWREATSGADDANSVMSLAFEEYWLFNIILSAILTWGIGLLPPLLIRFLFLRRPIARWVAITLVVTLLFIDIIVFTALGSQSKTHGALLLVAFVSYVVLHRGYNQYRSAQDLADNPSVEVHEDREATQSKEVGREPSVPPQAVAITAYVQHELEKVADPWYEPTTRDTPTIRQPISSQQSQPDAEPSIQESVSCNPGNEESLASAETNNCGAACPNRTTMVVLAIAVCAGEVLAYAVVGALVGWQHGGGAIPMMILFGAVAATWRAITKRASS